MENIYDVKIGKNNKRIFTDEQKDLIVELYTKYNKSMLCIANMFNLKSKYIISKILKERNVEIMCGGRKKYEYNEHYFDVIDTQEKAYILGLLYADGCNNDKKGTIYLSLQEQDKHILEEINNLIENSKPLYFVESRNKSHSNTYQIVLYSKHLCKVMNNYGMTPRKSLTLQFPLWMDENLYFHFLRGYVDGDGSMYFNKDKNIFRISMIGTELFLTHVSKIFNNIGVKTYISGKNKNDNSVTKQLAVTSNRDSMKLACYLYHNSNLKLSRKYEKCISYFLANNLNYNCLESSYNILELIKTNEQILDDIVSKNAKIKNINRWSKYKKTTKEESNKTNKAHRNVAEEQNPRARKIYCQELNKEFWGAMEAYKELGVDFSQIGKACKGKLKSAGKHPETGEPLHWKYI